MTREQALICRDLLRLAIARGFDAAYPLGPIAEKHGIASGSYLYDADRGSGILYDLSESVGRIWLADDNQAAGVPHEAHEMLESWCRNALDMPR